MLLILIGIIVGLLSGLFGIGGGSLYVPALVLCFQQTQQAAQGISLLVMLPTALLGGFFYLKNNLIQKEILLPLMLGGIIGALLGSQIALHIHSQLLSKLFAIFLFYNGMKMLKN